MIAFSIQHVDGKFIVQIERIAIHPVHHTVSGVTLAASPEFDDWAEAFDWGTQVVLSGAWERPSDAVIN